MTLRDPYGCDIGAFNRFRQCSYSVLKPEVNFTTFIPQRN